MFGKLVRSLREKKESPWSSPLKHRLMNFAFDGNFKFSTLGKNILNSGIAEKILLFWRGCLFASFYAFFSLSIINLIPQCPHNRDQLNTKRPRQFFKFLREQKVLPGSKWDLTSPLAVSHPLSWTHPVVQGTCNISSDCSGPFPELQNFSSRCLLWNDE